MVGIHGVKDKESGKRKSKAITDGAIEVVAAIVVALHLDRVDPPHRDVLVLLDDLPVVRIDNAIDERKCFTL